MANDAPAGSLSQNVMRYFSLLILFINSQSIVSNDVNRWQTDFWPPNHWPIIFPTMSPRFSQMSPLFQEPWDIVPSYEISRQNTVTGWRSVVKWIFHECKAPVIFTDDRQPVIYWATNHLLARLYFNFNTHEMTKRQVYPSDLCCQFSAIT